MSAQNQAGANGHGHRAFCPAARSMALAHTSRARSGLLAPVTITPYIDARLS